MASIIVFIQRWDSVSCDFSLDSSRLSFAGDSCLSMTGLKDMESEFLLGGFGAVVDLWLLRDILRSVCVGERDILDRQTD